VLEEVLRGEELTTDRCFLDPRAFVHGVAQSGHIQPPAGNELADEE
jgi:hypothetical protein